MTWVPMARDRDRQIVMSGVLRGQRFGPYVKRGGNVELYIKDTLRQGHRTKTLVNQASIATVAMGSPNLNRTAIV